MQSYLKTRTIDKNSKCFCLPPQLIEFLHVGTLVNTSHSPSAVVSSRYKHSANKSDISDSTVDGGYKKRVKLKYTINSNITLTAAKTKPRCTTSRAYLGKVQGK